MTIRVLLVDDHRLVREALRDTLSRDTTIEIVGEAGDAKTAIEAAQSLAPDVVVLDIGLPDMTGVEVAARLQKAGNTAKIVALSGYTEKHFVIEALLAGATAYVTKSSAGSELVRAIHAVAAGTRYACPEAQEALMSGLRSGLLPPEKPRLGRREREVLRLIADGLRSQAIADQLHIAVSTVEVHRRNIMDKLGLRTVAALTKHAIREGITSL